MIVLNKYQISLFKLVKYIVDLDIVIIWTIPQPQSDHITVWEKTLQFDKGRLFYIINYTISNGKQKRGLLSISGI